jgi:hypothetical protein
MGLSVCPIATIHASAETVWSLLADPSAYDSWWEVITDSITPAGLAQAGQIISAHGGALGINLRVRIRVDGVDDGRRQLDLTTWLPFGINLHNHILVQAIDEQACRVSFG